MLALSAVAIAWFGWQQFLEPVETDGVDAAVMPLVEETPVSETQVPAEKTEKGGVNRTLPASPPNANKDLAQSTTLPANVSENTRERKEKLSQSFNSYEEEKDTATDHQAELAPTTVAKAPSSPAPAQAATNQALAAEEAPLATPDKRTSRLQPHASDPISFWQIPQALRDGLPEFRINVLVYAEKPEDRFLLINGQRLVEKDELADGVVLDEIRRDGAVFLYRNYRFLVKG
jgi:hypothetical protein